MELELAYFFGSSHIRTMYVPHLNTFLTTIFNSIGQIFLLNTLLGRNFWHYGIEIIHRYWTKQIGILYTGNEYFPKVVCLMMIFVNKSKRM